MKYLVSYSSGAFGLKDELEDGDERYAEVPDDFMFLPRKQYTVFSDGTYTVVDKSDAHIVPATNEPEQFKSIVDSALTEV